MLPRNVGRTKKGKHNMNYFNSPGSAISGKPLSALRIHNFDHSLWTLALSYQKTQPLLFLSSSLPSNIGSKLESMPIFGHFPNKANLFTTSLMAPTVLHPFISFSFDWSAHLSGLPRNHFPTKRESHNKSSWWICLMRNRCTGNCMAQCGWWCRTKTHHLHKYPLDI